MKISIIIPIYNGAPLLERTIQCLREQTYRDFEVLLVNDGSTDQTERICWTASEGDQRFYYIYQQNAGVSAARNLGLSHARGDYITFLDADDIVPADYLSVLYDACQNADIAVCDVVSIQDGTEKDRFTHPDAVLSQREALELLLTRKKINSGPCAKLFRREVVEGLNFPPLKAYEDILFVRDAFCRAQRIAVTNRTEYRYIQNPAGAMSSFFKAPSADVIRATDALLAFIGSRRELSPDCFYITASHLMQYALPAAQMPAGRDFVRKSRGLYRKYWRRLLACPVFTWKEKIQYSMFILGWMYTERSIKRIGG